MIRPCDGWDGVWLSMFTRYVLPFAAARAFRSTVPAGR